MKKIFIPVFCFFLFLFLANTGNVLAAGSATVSWTAPTTDEGGGALTGLTGYRVYYDTTSNWASTCSLTAGSYENVSSGSTEEYFFSNTLTPGETYYFTVVAYDSSSNMSGCAQTAGSATEVSKHVSYTGDLDVDGDVGVSDYAIFHANYGSSGGGTVADMDKDNTVGIIDYAIFHADYNSAPLSGF